MRKANADPVRTRPRRPTPIEQIPCVILNPTLDDHLEILARAIFQAGLSWAMITARWDDFRAAFDRFNTKRVAAYENFEIDRLMGTDRIIHSAKKISGIISNAQTLLVIEAQHGSIANYARQFSCYADIFCDVRARFAFMGDLNCYYWLFRTNSPVPLFELWIGRQAKDHPRMREMVMAGRAAGHSSEHPDF